jgi:hypothetical protein
MKEKINVIHSCVQFDRERYEQTKGVGELAPGSPIEVRGGLRGLWTKIRS